jgi:hypothetical protein
MNLRRPDGTAWIKNFDVAGDRVNYGFVCRSCFKIPQNKFPRAWFSLLKKENRPEKPHRELNPMIITGDHRPASIKHRPRFHPVHSNNRALI